MASVDGNIVTGGKSILIEADHLVTGRGNQLAKAAVVVQDGRIVEVDASDACRRRWPDAQIYSFGNAIIMPGLVNAHQHGRGLSQIQLGNVDDFLETWIAGRRAGSPIDSGAVARLAAASMLANGVTTTVHGNYAYGTGNYEQEVRDQIAAYASAGLRLTMSIGAMDRGQIVYPPHEACFMAGLPADVKDWLSRPGNAPYCKDVASTIELMHRLRADFANEPLVRFCYGPAGPQWVSDRTWSLLAEDADRNGLGINMHALESPAQRDAARELYPDGVFGHLEKLGVMNERTVVAHAVWVDERDIEVLARTKATIVRNPGSNLRLRNGIAPLARYLQAGVRVAIGTDNCGMQDDEDLLTELRLAGTLGREPDWNGPPPPRPDQLLAMATINGAIAAQFGEETGILEPGRLADIAVFSLDRTNLPYLDDDMPILDAFLARGIGSDALLTMVGGKVRYHAGVFTDQSLAELEAAAADAAAASRLARNPKNSPLTRDYRIELGKHYRHVCGKGENH